MGAQTPRGTTGPGYDEHQSDPHKNHNHSDHRVEGDNQNTGSSGTTHGEGGREHNQ
jgi:hypothetical protein